MIDKREEILHEIIKDIYGIEPKGTVIDPIISNYKESVTLDKLLDKETHIHGTYDDGKIVSIKITALAELFDTMKMIMN